MRDTDDTNVKFRELYNNCFDRDGNIKACGRDQCKLLIKFMNNTYAQGRQFYGDAETGVMNVENIRTMHNVILNNT